MGERDRRDRVRLPGQSREILCRCRIRRQRGLHHVELVHGELASETADGLEGDPIACGVADQYDTVGERRRCPERVGEYDENGSERRTPVQGFPNT
jgi:hypothetical protein